MKRAKENAGNAVVIVGQGVGAVAGGTILATAKATITGATALAAAPAGVSVGPIFSTFIAAKAAAITPVWATLAVTPLGGVVIVGGGLALGGVLAFKLAKKLLE